MDVPEESEEKWPTDQMLKHIAKLVPQPRMKQLCEALQIPHTSEDQNNEEKRFKTICRWRDGITKVKQEEKSKVLTTALKSIGFDGLVLQLFKMSKSLKALVVSMRLEVCSILDKAGYPNVTKRFIFASEPSYGELFAIERAATQNDTPEDDADTPESSGEKKTSKKGKNKMAGEMKLSTSNEKAEELNTGPQQTPRANATLTTINGEETKNNDDDEEVTEDSGVAPTPVSDIENRSKHANSNTRRYRQRVRDLQIMLQLIDEDIPDRQMASVLTLLQIWKKRVCPGLLDHRVVLAEGLQKINKSHLIAGVVNGEYNIKETSLEFIKDMFHKMDEGRRISLRSLLEIKEEKQEKIMSSDEMSRRICQWVANWTKAKDKESSIKKNLKDAVRVKTTSERHRDFNDKLVDNGILDLAREIMNIEQVL